MTSLDMDVVAFDFDGTLADTAPDLAATLNHVLGLYGRPPVPPESVRNMVGHGARSLLRKGFAATGEVSEELVEEAFPLYFAHYSDHIYVGTRPFPGVERAMDDLTAGGVKLAICTNKNEALTLRLVEALGWNGRFAAIIGSNTLPVMKPDPAPLLEAIARAGGGKAIFVGDSITDADTARAADIPLIAVSFGFSDRPADQLGAHVVIDHFDELVPAVRTLALRPA